MTLIQRLRIWVLLKACGNWSVALNVRHGGITPASAAPFALFINAKALTDN
jgi:hypothetical protein